jgi:2-keto-4-pentenoate hydratase/2-oxohepta-3-ene-1,7-dioic acid hydratase in catechol pathway
MRIARIATVSGPRTVVNRDNSWAAIEDPYAKELLYTGEVFPLEGARLLCPFIPNNIIGISQNLTNNDHPLPLQAWYKAVQTAAGPEDEISLRSDIGKITIEGELAVVIGRKGIALTAENAFDYVLGYTVVNDVTNVTQVPIDERFFQAKSGINYTPFGPWIETELANPDDVAIEVDINGERVASSGSFNLPSDVATTIAYVASWVSLEPGDVILTGAPNTFAPVSPGDVVSITLPGIGTLTNYVGKVS